MKIAVVGTGYVGLVTGTCFSDLGHDVTCVDINEAKVNDLRAGKIPIYEPGLEELVHANAEQGRLKFTTNIREAIEECLVLFVAVGTPPTPEGKADLRFVLQVATSVGEHMNGYKVIVDKSTVPVGTAAKVRQAIQDALDVRGAKFEFDVVSNPEFLREGSAIDDFMRPDRIVIGCDDERTRILMNQLYAHFTQIDRPILSMSTESAEMTKYAANAMLATKISFMNEVANICERVGAHVDDVRNGIGSDNRIGFSFISPGIGYGGSCFPKDVKALVQTADEVGYSAELLKSVDTVNEQQKLSLVEKIKTYYRGQLKDKCFAVWGLAFKPETDDIRESPALVIIEELVGAGAKVRAHDPKAMQETEHALGKRDNVEYVANYYETLDGCDALIVATEWPFFRNPDFGRIRGALSTPVIFDGRNIYDRDMMRIMGFDYFSLGRAPIFAHSSPGG
jgi:UDPglucose 6-dehydrogenase